jgi:hypothetical protein
MSLCHLDDYNNEFLYLIKEREFIKTKLNKKIYKELNLILMVQFYYYILLQMIVIKMKN